MAGAWSDRREGRGLTHREAWPPHRSNPVRGGRVLPAPMWACPSLPVSLATPRAERGGGDTPKITRALCVRVASPPATSPRAYARPRPPARTPPLPPPRSAPRSPARPRRPRGSRRSRAATGTGTRPRATSCSGSPSRSPRGSPGTWPRGRGGRPAATRLRGHAATGITGAAGLGWGSGEGRLRSGALFEPCGGAV